MDEHEFSKSTGNDWYSWLGESHTSRTTDNRHTWTETLKPDGSYIRRIAGEKFEEQLLGLVERATHENSRGHGRWFYETVLSAIREHIPSVDESVDRILREKSLPPSEMYYRTPIVATAIMLPVDQSSFASSMVQVFSGMISPRDMYILKRLLYVYGNVMENVFSLERYTY